MKKILKRIINPKGFSYVMATVIMFVTIMIGVAIFEVIRINIQASAVRNKFEDAIIAMCVDNYKDMYQPVREGYAASYKNSGSGFVKKNTANTHFISNYLNTAMNSGEISQCNIVDIDYTVDCATLRSDTTTYNITGKLTVELPYDFGWSDTVNPIDLELDVKSKWTARF